MPLFDHKTRKHINIYNDGVAFGIFTFYIHKFVTGKVKQYNLDADRSCMPFLYKQKMSL